MDMEQRKTSWRNRVHHAADGTLSPRQISRIVSICQDAFNAGHAEGWKLGQDAQLKENPLTGRLEP